MQIKALHPNFKMPVKSTSGSGAFDLFMPEAGTIESRDGEGYFARLGFAAAVPEGHVALILPRSGKGAKDGVSLNNTVGVIDSDYRGEWIACLRLRNTGLLNWEAGERLLQVLIVPVSSPELIQVDELSDTERGAGGFGSTG